METFELLVSMLSIVLIVLLLIIIVAIVYFVKILRKVNDISDKASHVMDSVEAAGKVFEKSAAPVAVSRIISNIIEGFSDKKKGKK